MTDVLSTARRLGAELKRATSAEWAGPCPKCGGRDRFSVNVGKGVWNCRGCGEGGDAIDLARHVLGVSFGEAKEFVTGEEQRATVAQPVRREPDPNDAAQRERKARYIADIIAGLRPIASTPAEAYLLDERRIDVKAIADVLDRTDALGWHPAVRFNEHGHALHAKHLGAIIAIMTDPVTGKATGGISRTYVHEGRKVWKAKGLGPAGVVRLTPDDEVLTGLHIAEGLETCLAGMAIGYRPMWSAGSTSIMAKFPIVAGIEALSIIADNDSNGAGEAAAKTCARRWRDAGRETRILMPRASGADLNDILKGGFK